MEDSSQKMNEIKTNPSVSVSDTFSEQLKDNLEKKSQNLNVDGNLNKNSEILKNIKSEYTIKILFFHLDEKIKLKLIKYNKNLQNTIDINLNNYKNFTGKYLKLETRVKEYNKDGKLIFIGEYLNGKRWNGKGKEYDYAGKLRFEGEYLNGNRNGKGKLYNYGGTSLIDAEYLNNQINGKVKKI